MLSVLSNGMLLYLFIVGWLHIYYRYFSQVVCQIFSLCVCMWVFRWIALGGGDTCRYVCYSLVATGQAWVLLVNSPPYFGGIGSFTGLGLTRLADQRGPGSTSPVLRFRAHIPMPHFFTWVLGLTLWASCKRFTTWAISSALTCSFYYIILSVVIYFYFW